MGIHDDAADAIIDQATAALRDVPIPEGPSRAVRDSVRRAGAPLPTRRRPRFFLRYATAAAFLGILVVLMGWWNHGAGTARVAFGDVTAKLNQVHTVTYRSISKTTRMRETIERVTLAMDGKFSRNEFLEASPGPGVPEMVRNYAIYNQGRMLNVDNTSKKATLHDYVTDSLPHALAVDHTLASLAH